MTLVVRDEADILETLLSYHLDQGVDRFVVTDHASTDGTREILDSYVARGVAQVIDEPGEAFAQNRWVTRMARLAHDELRADWVVHADADEFCFADDATLREVLAAVPREYGVVEIPRINFRPRPEDGRPFHQRMIAREAAHALERPLLPKVCHRARPDVAVATGNHKVHGSGLRRFPEPRFEIFHYPMRTYAQFARKVGNGAQAVMRNPEYRPGAFMRWHWYYDMLCAGRLQGYYDSLLVDDEAMAAGVRCGDLIADDRLARRLAG